MGLNSAEGVPEQVLRAHLHLVEGDPEGMRVRHRFDEELPGPLKFSSLGSDEHLRCVPIPALDVVGLGTNDIERRYRDAAQVLIASEGRELERARQFLIEAMPDSHTFRVAFDKMQMGTQYLLRYTLGRIEAHLFDGAETVLKPNNLVHIEHVMPQTLTEAWADGARAGGCGPPRRVLEPLREPDSLLL